MAGQKRSATDLEPEAKDYGYTEDDNDDTPRLVRRHHGYAPKRVPFPILSATLYNSRPFSNIYTAILRHPNIFFEFALRLPHDVLLDLYAIDKEFHFRFNKYGVSLIHDHARYHARLSSHIFSWSMFPSLCISDPTLKPMDNRVHLARDIPSLRWSKMVIFRDAVVREILTLLALDGHRVPRATDAALMKYWHIMSKRKYLSRLAFIRDRDMLSDQDIICFQLFLVKLDMRFGDPVEGQGACELSHMLLSQKSLSVLRDVLSGKLVLNHDNSTDMARRTFQTSEFDMDEVPWMDDMIDNGVVESEWGLMSREGWNELGNVMPYAVDLVIEEGIRRGLNIQRFYMDFLTYGCVDLETGRNMEDVRRYKGQREVVVTEGRAGEGEIAELMSKLDRVCGFDPRQAPNLQIGSMTVRLPL